MKRLRLLVPGVVLLALISESASATVVFTDNFDGYANQTAFNAVWTASTTTGTLTSALSKSAPKSVIFAITAQRNDHSVGELGNFSATNHIKFSFDFYDSRTDQAPYRQFASITDSSAPSGSGQLFSLGLNNNLALTADGGNYYMASVLGYNGDAFFKLNEGGASTLRTVGAVSNAAWHKLAVDISDTQVLFYVDSILAKTLNVSLTQRSLDLIRIGSNLSASFSANIDNVLVETNNPAAVPEASSFLLGGLICSGLGLRFASRRLRGKAVA